MMRRSNQDKDFSFPWSLIHEMGGVAASNASSSTLLLPPSGGAPNTLWSMPPVSLSEKERMSNSTAILSLLCDSAVLEPYLKSLLSARLEK